MKFYPRVHLKIRLTDADVSLIPKTITDNGKTLTLTDVQWSSSEGVDGEGGASTHYTATAQYTGTTSSRYATGYTVTANYVGEVAKTNCSVVTYTAIFGSVEEPKASDAPVEPDPSKAPDTPEETGASKESAGPDNDPIASINWAQLKTPLLMGGVVLVLAAGGGFAVKKLRRR